MGFDAFFFDVDILDGAAHDRHFRLGETWWDYWFPLQLAANGATIGNIDLPLILHRMHNSRWTPEQWVDHGRQFWGNLKVWSQRNELPSFLSTLDYLDNVEEPDSQQLSRLGIVCFEWLRTRRLPSEVKLLPNGMTRLRRQRHLDSAEAGLGEFLDHSLEKMLGYAHRSFGDIAAHEIATQTELATTQTELATTQTELATTQTELAATRTELATIKSSEFWRMTAPLRQILYHARRFGRLKT